MPTTTLYYTVKCMVGIILQSYIENNQNDQNTLI